MRLEDVVVPAIELVKAYEIIRLNIGDPLAYEGLPTPEHMISQHTSEYIDSQDNGYGPSYGIPSLRQKVLARLESGKGWIVQKMMYTLRTE